MGLKYAEDITAWSRWQANAHPLRRGKVMAQHAVNYLKNRGNEPADNDVTVGYLHTSEYSVDILFVLDSTTPTAVSSLVQPAAYLRQKNYAVWAPEDITHLLPEADWHVRQVSGEELAQYVPSAGQVVALGHYMEYGRAAYQFSQDQGAQFVTVQHGLHTPYAPPLAHGTHLLAFSQADAEFWISGRSDVTYDVVGSQLFWEAAQKPKVELPESEQQPIFLGQMHGAELSRRSYARAGFQFCRQTGARYRPHPNEKDKLSVLTHALWEKMGIDIDRGGEPLNTLTNPVVSIFSTGVLEAAIRGVPAWVYHPNPPAWVQEFWERYGLHQWGDTPTPAPAVPAVPPAQAIAAYLEEKLQ